MESIVNLIVSNGLGVVLVGYFIYKDYKFNESILNVLGKINEVLARLETWHEKESVE